jgi:hypothetical protein
MAKEEPSMATATWEEIMKSARALEADALRDCVPPEQGARFVRLVLLFHENLTKGAVARSRCPDEESGRQG